jgi:serine protease Do
MRSLLKFFIFVAVLAVVVAAVYLWRSAAPPAPMSGNTPSVVSKLPSLAAIDREFTTLVNAALPSVVSINAIPAEVTDPRANLLRQLLNLGPTGQAPSQLGAGAIISEDGYIVTNWHVIQKAGAVEVYLNDGRPLAARLLGADPLSDVAVLKVDATGLKPLEFGDSDAVSVGQMVFAVGNPFGLSESVTQGIISAKGRRTSTEATNEFLQTDTPINPGNSGGPLIDLSGRLIGLNNSILLRTDGIGFSIPANTVRRVYENIRDHGRVIRPWFGVTMIPLTPALAAHLGLDNQRGALVAEPIAGSPAARAGIQSGDLIISYNGRPVADSTDLRNRIVESEPGREVVLTVKRRGQTLTLRALIEKQPGE